MQDVVIHNAILVPMTKEGLFWEKAWISFTNGIITHIATDETALPPAKETIDAQKGIVLPGLINAHTHIPMSLFRGMTRDMALQEWLTKYLFPAEAKFITEETVSIGTQLSCAEMLLGGITTCIDGYFFQEQIAQAIDAIGMRAVLGQAVLDFPVPGVSNPKEVLPTAQKFASAWKNKSPRIQSSIFAHSPYTCSIETLIAAKAFTRSENLLYQIHVSETKEENDQFFDKYGMSPVQMLAKYNLLDTQTLLIHGVWLSDTDIEIIAQSGASVTHCPESNMKLASGILPFQRLQEKGVNLALGTDGCASNNDQDMFGEMDTAAKLHKVATLDSTLADAYTVLSMATRNGAKALGAEDLLGTLEVGKKADIILVNTQKPHLQPIYNPISHLVYTAAASDVDSVWVDGHAVVRRRQLQTLDTESIYSHLKPISNRIQQFIHSLDIS